MRTDAAMPAPNGRPRPTDPLPNATGPGLSVGDRWRHARIDRFDRIARIATRLFKVAAAWVEDETEEQLYRFANDDTGPSCATSPWPATLPGLPCDLLTHADEATSGHPVRRLLDQSGLPCATRIALRDDHGTRLGTLVLADPQPRRLDEVELDTLQAFVHTIAAELSMQRQSTTDPLTGLLNRLGFWQAGETLLALSRTGQLRASLLLFDLDGFKQINDRFGHAEGDRALAHFSAMLRDCFRATDLVARLGGDEFAVLANGTGRHAVVPALRRLQAELDATAFGAELGYRLGFSVGVVPCTGHGTRDLDALIALADESMYANKRRRREQPGRSGDRAATNSTG
ncbi:MAG: GGDEF domain-containing protein [Burkholderiaceae bacterium]|nr:GGDEF domain-containing protein [Rhodoferax sp.]MCP5284766.1 GGDEF domain-containing protein [Burkholderiaceae bacterium]